MALDIYQKPRTRHRCRGGKQDRENGVEWGEEGRARIPLFGFTRCINAPRRTAPHRAAGKITDAVTRILSRRRGVDLPAITEAPSAPSNVYSVVNAGRVGYFGAVMIVFHSRETLLHPAPPRSAARWEESVNPPSARGFVEVPREFSQSSGTLASDGRSRTRNDLENALWEIFLAERRRGRDRYALCLIKPSFVRTS